MAVTFDASSAGHQGYGGNVTMSHTVGAGSDRLLVAMVSVGSNTDKVTGVTYGGVAMTRIRAEATGGATTITYVYALTSPATGTANIVFTFATADCPAVGHAASFFGVDQTTPISANAGINDGFKASPESLPIAVASGGVAVDIIGSSVTSDALVVDGSQTQTDQRGNDGGMGGTMRAAMSYKADAAAMAWTWAGGTRVMSHSVVALAPASGGTTTATVAYTEASDTVAVSVNITSGSTTATVAYTEASDTVAASVQIGATLTTRQFRNNTGPTGLHASVANVALNIYNATTGTLVLRLTGLTTNAQGRLVVSDAALSAGTTYAYEADFSAAGLGRRLPTAAAA